jgi:hypothetical protein
VEHRQAPAEAAAARPRSGGRQHGVSRQEGAPGEQRLAADRGATGALLVAIGARFGGEGRAQSRPSRAHAGPKGLGLLLPQHEDCLGWAMTWQSPLARARVEDVADSCWDGGGSWTWPSVVWGVVDHGLHLWQQGTVVVAV